ncbi:unnamed protein product [Amoebophrya sp. A120]|nr:unnamed protein product [Amoebophrya sp. A120]|eukprot:GSA120T00001005001.1
MAAKVMVKKTKRKRKPAHKKKVSGATCGSKMNSTGYYTTRKLFFFLRKRRHCRRYFPRIQNKTSSVKKKMNSKKARPVRKRTLRAINKMRPFLMRRAASGVLRASSSTFMVVADDLPAAQIKPPLLKNSLACCLKRGPSFVRTTSIICTTTTTCSELSAPVVDAYQTSPKNDAPVQNQMSNSPLSSASGSSSAVAAALAPSAHDHTRREPPRRGPATGASGAQSPSPRSVEPSTSSLGAVKNGTRQMGTTNNNQSRDNKKIPPDDLEAVQQLVQRQFQHLPRILAELQEHGAKRSHWAWWACFAHDIWPTDKEGNAEPGAPTRVTEETARILCGEHPLIQNAAGDLPEEQQIRIQNWRTVLELIAELQEKAVPLPPGGKTLPGGQNLNTIKATSRVIPGIDHGRIHFFNEFWANHPDCPPWLLDVITRYRRYDWGR